MAIFFAKNKQEKYMEIPNLISNAASNKTLNNKATDSTNKAKDFIGEEKDSLERFGNTAYQEVESMASDVIKQLKTQFSDSVTNALGFVKKHPLITVAAAVTAGLVIARMMSRPSNQNRTTESSLHH